MAKKNVLGLTNGEWMQWEKILRNANKEQLIVMRTDLIIRIGKLERGE